MKGSLIDDLAEILKEAKAAALAADPGESASMTGTCNLDSPVFCIAGARAAAIEKAAAKAEVSVSRFTWWGQKNWYFINGVALGQADRRTTMTDAAVKILRQASDSGKIAGFTGCGYYQAD